jgi:hypothetical protein
VVGGTGVISDFKPSANFAGGVAVPVLTYALNAPWLQAWDL